MRHVRADELPLGAPDDDLVVEGENLTALARLPDELFDVVYIDPPFNTGRTQRRARYRRAPRRRRRRPHRLRRPPLPHRAASPTWPSATTPSTTTSPSSRRASRRPTALLAPHGTLYFHIDYREAHYCKVLLDRSSAASRFLNEIIWAYDYGARSTRRWPAKHDTILVYVKDPARYHFDSDRGRPRAVHGAGARDAREGGAREAPQRLLLR